MSRQLVKALSALTTITHIAVLSHSLSHLCAHTSATSNHVILYTTTNGHGYTLTVTQLIISH